MQLADEEIIYIVSTRNVQSIIVVNVGTSVEPEIASMMAVSICQSLEAASDDLDIDFADAVKRHVCVGRPRPFERSSQNKLHARISGSIADSLNVLWPNSGREDGQFFLSADNDLLGDYKDVPLYNVVLQAYVSPGALWVFVGIVMLFVLTMFVVSNVCVLICPTAVAENN